MKAPPSRIPAASVLIHRLAFSLTEVVIALGVFSFATISILGVLPTAVSTIRDSSQRQVVSDILTQVAADLRAVSGGLGSIEPDKEFPRYFDQRGVLLRRGGEVPSAAAYRVDFKKSGPVAHDGKEALNQKLGQVSLVLQPVSGGTAPVVFKVGFITL